MPRQPRLDAPGLFHHVIARGIERRDIFINKSDYEDFLSRVETSLEKSPNQIFAWALMPNHFHFLIRSGSEGISRFMRRLMSGYAVAFNLRHKRTGYLFQNRFKSIVCDGDVYFNELVRYIHLNPFRAGIVKNIEGLDSFPYSGHSAVMGVIKRPWQATGETLSLFGSLGRYKRFIEDGKDQGRRAELVGGGLIRSLGGGFQDKLHLREEDNQAFDDRVLGGGDFVERVLKETGSLDQGKAVLRHRRCSLSAIGKRIAEEAGLLENQLYIRGRGERVSRAKAILIHVGVEYFKETTKRMGEITKMSTPAASKSRMRGVSFIRGTEIEKWMKVN